MSATTAASTPGITGIKPLMPSLTAGSNTGGTGTNRANHSPFVRAIYELLMASGLTVVALNDIIFDYMRSQRIFVLGGSGVKLGGSVTMYSSVLAYDPYQNTWTEQPALNYDTVIRGSGVCVVADRDHHHSPAASKTAATKADSKQDPNRDPTREQEAEAIYATRSANSSSGDSDDLDRSRFVYVVGGDISDAWTDGITSVRYWDMLRQPTREDTVSAPLVPTEKTMNSAAEKAEASAGSGWLNSYDHKHTTTTPTDPSKIVKRITAPQLSKFWSTPRWVTSVPMSAPHVHVFGADQSIWIFHEKKTQCYDLRTEKWTVKAPPPEARPTDGTRTSLVVGSRVWVIGGHGNTDIGKKNVDVYDSVHDYWLDGPQLPIGVGDAAACVWWAPDPSAPGGRRNQPLVVLAGGAFRANANETRNVWCCDPTLFRRVLDQFGNAVPIWRPPTGVKPAPVAVCEWLPFSELLRPRSGHRMIPINNTLYVLGGRCEPLSYSMRVEMYDVTNARWKDVAPLPNHRRYAVTWSAP